MGLPGSGGRGWRSRRGGSCPLRGGRGWRAWGRGAPSEGVLMLKSRQRCTPEMLPTGYRTGEETRRLVGVKIQPSKIRKAAVYRDIKENTADYRPDVLQFLLQGTSHVQIQTISVFIRCLNTKLHIKIQGSLKRGINNNQQLLQKHVNQWRPSAARDQIQLFILDLSQNSQISQLTSDMRG